MALRPSRSAPCACPWAAWRAVDPSGPATAAASSERTIALTGPTPAGVIEKFSAPIPSAPSPRAGDRPSRRKFAPARPPARADVEHALEEAQDRRAQPVVALRQPRVGAVGGEQELGEIVGADRQEIDRAAAAGRAFRRGSELRASRRTRSSWAACDGPCAPIRPVLRTVRAPPHIPTARRSSGT